MDAIDHLERVLELLDRFDLEIRVDHLGGSGGGLCIVGGRRLVFVDLDADPATSADYS